MISEHDLYSICRYIYLFLIIEVNFKIFWYTILLVLWSQKKSTFLYKINFTITASLNYVLCLMLFLLVMYLYSLKCLSSFKTGNKKQNKSRAGILVVLLEELFEWVKKEGHKNNKNWENKVKKISNKRSINRNKWLYVNKNAKTKTTKVLL